MMKINSFLTLFVILSNVYLSWQLNEVILTEQEVYKYDFTITYGMTMSIQDTLRDKFEPVIYDSKENTFYKRDSSLDTQCGKLDKVVDQNELSTIVAASGVHRHLILINGMFPGPPIFVPKDAIVEINIHNKLYSDVVNIHWHGQEQKGTFFMDGVPGITECPIGPGENYTYKFRASKVGTHWYHAHSGVQRTDGLYGAFIVKDTINAQQEAKKISLDKFNKTVENIENIETAEKAQKYDKEFFIMLQDWVKPDSEAGYSQIHWRQFKFSYGYDNTSVCFWHNRMIDGSFLPPIPFDTILFNGKGWTGLPTNLNQLNKNLLNLPLDSFTVEPNKKYLFRVISASAGHPFEVSVSGHKLRVVATDGNQIKPIEEVDSFIIHSGERYDFELDTKTEAESDNFFIIAKTMDKLTFNFSKFNEEHFGLAILHYSNVNPKELKKNYVRQCSSQEPCHVANCFYAFNRPEYKCTSADKFESLSIPAEDRDILSMQFPSRNFEEHLLNFHFSGQIEKRASINNYQFTKPSIPAYFNPDPTTHIRKCGPECIDEKLCECTHMLNLKTEKIVQLVFFSMGIGSYVNNTAHPIHLHGHHFYVMKMGFPTYDPTTGILKTNNRDLSCAEEVNSCNNVNWSNKEWQNGNIPSMSSAPAKKDSIFIPMGGYVVVRFRTDNIGYWFLHCHIENHMVEGMSLIVQEGTNEQIRNLVKWDQINTCGKGFQQPKLNNSPILKQNYFVIILFNILCFFLF